MQENNITVVAAYKVTACRITLWVNLEIRRIGCINGFYCIGVNFNNFKPNAHMHMRIDNCNKILLQIMENYITVGTAYRVTACRTG